MDKPTLDAAALDKVQKAREELHGLCSGKRKFTMRVPVDRERDSDVLISDGLDVAEQAARLALTQSERIATLEAELAEAQRDATFGAPLIVESYKSELLQRDVTINALRDALEKANAAFNAWGRDEDGIHPEAWPAVEHLREVLLATPAASLAAAKDSLRSHDAEVLERAAKYHDECAIECRNDADRETFAESVRDFISQAQVHERSAAHFRALAAQEVKP